MSLPNEEEQLGRAYDGRLMRRLLHYIRPHRWKAAGAVLATMLLSVTQVAGPFLNQVAIDRYLFPSSHGTHNLLARYLPANPYTGIATIGLLYIGVLLLGFGLDFAQTYAMQWVGQHSMYDLRRELFAHLQRLPVAFFDRNPVGRLVTRVTNDVEALNDTISDALVALINDCFILVMIVLVMFYYNWRLALVTLSVLPLIFLATARFRRAVRESYRRIRLAVARINVFLQEHIAGMAVVQAFNREAPAFEEFRAINRQHCDAWTDQVFAYSVYYPVVMFLGTVAVTLALWYGGLRVMHNALSIGIVFAFIRYAQNFFRPIQDLSDRYNTLQSAMASSERIFRLLDTPLPAEAAAAPAPLPAGPGRIEFDHVWFAYHDEDWVLRDVSFTVEPGASVAVVGHTGAGKTTLMSLVLRFYDVRKGRILLDGVDIRTLDVHDLRRRFAVVLQDPYLFTGTIADNIRMDDRSISDARVEHAAAQVCLQPYLDSLPEGTATLVRERGAGLSTGQKQLVSFARALANDPEILILDEATASIDTETERRIRDALNTMLAGRTSIVIAHRLSTIQRADLILVMHKGVLRERGSHQQLLRQRGIYWRLYRLQYQDQERHEPAATLAGPAPDLT